MSRTLMLLDEEGWGELMDALEGTLNEVSAIQKRASSRLAKSGEEGINVSAAVMGFEIPEAPSKRARAPKKKARAKAPRKAKTTK
jgi:hypothetical protein